MDELDKDQTINIGFRQILWVGLIPAVSDDITKRIYEYRYLECGVRVYGDCLLDRVDSPP